MYSNDNPKRKSRLLQTQISIDVIGEEIWELR